MADLRIRKYAETLVNYSLNVEKGNLVVIQGYHLAYPLIEACYEEVLKAGAHPYVLYRSDLNEILLREGTDEQIKYVSPISEEVMKKVDRLLSIGGGNNTKLMASIDPKRIAILNKAHSVVKKIQMERAAEGLLNWSLCMYPTHSAAQEANMSLREYEEFIFDACMLNEEDPIDEWQKIRDNQQSIVEYLNNKKHFRIVSKDTDIEMSIADRNWINSDGRNNFPSGEVYTAPVEDSVNGHIRFSFPGIYSGQEIEDIQLTFKDGEVAEAKASKGQKLLEALLNIDEGSKRVGEVAIGTNYNIKKFTRNMLFDEKIGGTIHLALGSAYAKSGGQNQSAIHWDMLCDMRSGGEIYADGEKFYENGNIYIDI